jgi:hypothetical protein
MAEGSKKKINVKAESAIVSLIFVSRVCEREENEKNERARRKIKMSIKNVGHELCIIKKKIPSGRVSVCV